MKKFGYLLLLIAFIYGCERPEKPIKPFDRGSVITNSVSMGNTYADHIFFNLDSNKIIKTIKRMDWDIAFDCQPNRHIILLNGIYLLISLNDIACEKYYNKYRCNFDPSNHKDIIDNIKIIEENILKKIDIKKTPQLKISEQLRNGNIKLFNMIDQKDSSFIIKISGVWETQYNYGLTYKFIKVTN